LPEVAGRGSRRGKGELEGGAPGQLRGVVEAGEYTSGAQNWGLHLRILEGSGGILPRAKREFFADRPGFAGGPSAAARGFI